MVSSDFKCPFYFQTAANYYDIALQISLVAWLNLKSKRLLVPMATSTLPNGRMHCLVHCTGRRLRSLDSDGKGPSMLCYGGGICKSYHTYHINLQSLVQILVAELFFVVWTTTATTHRMDWETTVAAEQVKSARSFKWDISLICDPTYIHEIR